MIQDTIRSGFAGAPVVTAMEVIPVAGRDGMLLNLSGAHAPFFTRNLVILTDNSGHTGVGEVPGGEGGGVRTFHRRVEGGGDGDVLGRPGHGRGLVVGTGGQVVEPFSQGPEAGGDIFSG